MFFDKLKQEMVEDLKQRKIIISKNVYKAMMAVPRHLFVPENLKHRAYFDTPQQIGDGQTISAPHMNAMMCEYLEIKKGQRILEIGTGSGYHAALLGELVGKEGKVFTIERHEKLVNNAQKILNHELGYNNITVVHGDGTLGLEKSSPFDRILVTAAGPKIPRPLLAQLSSDNGIICIPVGKKKWDQQLLVIQRIGDKYSKRRMCGVVFVPLIGEYGFDK